MKQTLRNAQLTTLLFGCALAIFAFIKGASLQMSPLKQNYILLIGFAELIVIFSLVSIFVTRKNN
jgi:hypothetical protein